MIANIRALATACAFYMFGAPVPGKGGDCGKSLFLDIRDNLFGRYLYLFLKFFLLEGYVVYLPKSLTLIRRLQGDPIAAGLLQEGSVHFGKPPGTGATIVIGQKSISADYFSKSDDDVISSRVYYVPMSQHPLMYHNGWWNAPIEDGGRKRSVFMAGNFDPGAYGRLEKDRIFEVMSRTALYDLLAKRKLLYGIDSLDKMMAFLDSGEDHKIILVNRLICDIPMWHLRNLLGKFDFYFALPGVVMPFSHNIIEAMSSGAIPFIQESYAGLFKPVLEDEVHAILFKGQHDLEARLDYMLRLPRGKIASMRTNIYAYYNEHLTPAAVVQKIEGTVYDKIFLQAEGESVKLFKLYPA